VVQDQHSARVTPWRALKGSVEVIRALNRQPLELNRQWGSRRRRRPELRWRDGTGRVPEDAHARHRRMDLPEKLKPFGGEVGELEAEHSYIPSRPTQTRDKAGLHGIGGQSHHDGDGRGRLL